MAWASGFFYVGYDTWLLFFVAARTRDCRRAAPAGPLFPRPTVSAAIAARNERLILPACLDALLRQDSPPDEILVIDDGSTDGSVEWLERAYGVVFSGELGRSTIRPELAVLRKPHTGKADSLNRALHVVRGEVLITVDADTLLELDAVGAMRRAFASEPRLAAACGVLTPRCRPGAGATLLETFQRFEYMRAFLAREAWMREDALLLVSGAFAAYRRDVLLELGGYDRRSLVEDYELIHRLHRFSCERERGLTVRLVSAARAVTDAPATLRALLKQRLRWFGGFLQTQFKNRDMVGDPRYGAVGRLILPVKAFDTLQPLYGLLAFAALLGLLASGHGISGPILWVLAGKLALDVSFHFWFLTLYSRWQGLALDVRLVLISALVTLAEPVSFQLLRHIGALLGWLSFLSGANDWSPQRDVNTAQEAA